MGRKNATRTKRRNMRVKMRRNQSYYGKLFNGNIFDQGEFIFIWLLVLAYFIGMWLFMFIGNLPVNENKCENISLTVRSVNITFDDEHRKLSFTVYENDEEYTVSSWASDIDGFERDIHDGSSLTVVFEKKEIVSIFNDEKYYLTIDDTNLQRSTPRTASYIILGFAAVWILYIAVSWYVMYNAEKFPRLVKFFVKPSYINKNKIRKGT